MAPFFDGHPPVMPAWLGFTLIVVVASTMVVLLALQARFEIREKRRRRRTDADHHEGDDHT